MPKGKVVAIFIAPDKSVPLIAITTVRAVSGKGLEGDRYFKQTGTYSGQIIPGREVTLIEIETLEALKRDLNIELGLGESRRNIVTRGVPLNHLVGKKFRVGTVLMIGTRLCEPCGYLESQTDKGVRRALEHRGGLNAQILEDGILNSGDYLVIID